MKKTKQKQTKNLRAMHGQIQDLLSSVLFHRLVILHRPYPFLLPPFFCILRIWQHFS